MSRAGKGTYAAKVMADDPSQEDDEVEEEERVTAHSYGALDTSQVEDECWLIRIPQKLAELWDKAPEGTDLGELVFTKGGNVTTTTGRVNNVKPSLTVHVSEELGQLLQSSTSSSLPHKGTSSAKSGSRPAPPPPPIPLNYSLQAMTKKVPILHPFIRNPNNGSVKILGTVSRTANLQVERDDTYRKQLKDRLVATNITASRFVKPVENVESIMNKQRSSGGGAGGSNLPASSSSKSFGNAIYQYGKRMLEAAEASSSAASMPQPASKKARQFAPDQSMKSVLFELFAQQPFWTLKDLKAAAAAGGATTTKRTEAEIKDILHEIGEYHRKGDHKNMWELRQEFQKQD